MKHRLLVTADRDTAAPFLERVESEADLLHLPLELSEYRVTTEEDEALTEILDKFSFVLYENLRDARHFVEWVNRNEHLETVQKMVHLTVDQPSTAFLEGEKIPAICPKARARPIDLMEFMLRISREGSSLCPAHESRTGELPGLLQELDIPVSEFRVTAEKSIPAETLETYREMIRKEEFGTILIHNRSALVRIRTAFPDLDLSSYRIISGSAGLTLKLQKEGIEPDLQANGTWHSIADSVLDSLGG